MIPRYQRILFAVLLGGSLVMAILLMYLHQHNFSDVKNADNTPIEATLYSPTENVTLMVANDADGELKPVTRTLALPQQPALRAHALLDHLLAGYALPHAEHITAGGVAIDDVFLVSLPLGTGANTTQQATPSSATQDSNTLTSSPGELAVINLRSAWADAHPSGITSETLTLQSILATLHANFPDITAVKFLADGKPRETLAGNIELDRIYNPLETAQTGP